MIGDEGDVDDQRGDQGDPEILDQLFLRVDGDELKRPGSHGRQNIDELVGDRQKTQEGHSVQDRTEHHAVAQFFQVAAQRHAAVGAHRLGAFSVLK